MLQSRKAERLRGGIAGRFVASGSGSGQLCEEEISKGHVPKEEPNLPREDTQLDSLCPTCI